jgi:hypothetical protein
MRKALPFSLLFLTVLSLHAADAMPSDTTLSGAVSVSVLEGKGVTASYSGAASVPQGSEATFTVTSVDPGMEFIEWRINRGGTWTKSRDNPLTITCPYDVEVQPVAGWRVNLGSEVLVPCTYGHSFAPVTLEGETVLVSSFDGRTGDEAATRATILVPGSDPLLFASVEARAKTRTWLVSGDADVGSDWTEFHASNYVLHTLRQHEPDGALVFERDHVTIRRINTYTGCYIEARPEGQGSVLRDPDKPCYNPGEIVTLTAVPGKFATFVRWDGSAYPNDPTNPVWTATMFAGDQKFVVTPQFLSEFPMGGLNFTVGSGTWTDDTRDGVAAVLSTQVRDAVPDNHLQARVEGPGCLSFRLELTGDCPFYLSTSGFFSETYLAGVTPIDERVVIPVESGSVTVYFSHDHGSFSTSTARISDVKWESGWMSRVQDAGSGAVTQSTPGTIFPAGTKVTYTATPPAGASFVKWMVNDVTTSNANPLVWDGNAHLSLRPIFRKVWTIGAMSVTAESTWLWTRAADGGFVPPQHMYVLDQPLVLIPQVEHARIRVKARQLDSARAASMLQIYDMSSFMDDLSDGETGTYEPPTAYSKIWIEPVPGGDDSTDISNVKALLEVNWRVFLDVPGAVVQLQGTDEGFAANGSTVHYKVIPCPGNYFAGWTSGDLTGTAAEGDLVVTRSLSATGEVVSWTSSDIFFRRWVKSQFSGDRSFRMDIAGSTADPDGDGWNNYMEYLNGTEADSPDSGIVAEMLGVTGGRRNVRLTFPFLHDSLGGAAHNSDKPVRLEYSTRLDGGWQDASGLIYAQNAVSRGSIYLLSCSLTLPAGLGSRASVFFRLHYTGSYPIDSPAKAP